MGDAETLDVVEQPAETPVETPDYEAPAEHEEVSEQVITPEPREEPGQEEITPGEVTSKQITQALKQLRETDPRVADELRKAYFSAQDWAKTFASPREAKIARLAWDSVGGETGFATLREQVQASEYLEQAAESGDSSIIDDWAQDYPQGFRDVAPYALKKFAQLDPQAFQQAIAPHFSGFLDRSQLADRLSEAYDAIGANNPQGAQSLLRNIYAWVQAQKQQAGQPAAEAASPQADRLAQRENALNEREETAFRKGIGSETFAYQQSQVQKALQPYLKGSKLSDQAKTRLVTTINADIQSNLEKNPGFQRQMQAYLAKKDARGTVDYLKGQLDLIIGSITKQAWQDLYGTAPKAARTTPVAGSNGQAKAAAGPIRLTHKPMLSEIRKDKDYMAAYIAGQAIMAKGPYKGKLVRWK
jgi:hypothetical protein